MHIDPTPLQIGAIFAILATAAGSMWLPFVVHNNKALVAVGNMFSTGVLLSASLVHMLPDAESTLGDALPKLDYPLASLLCGITFLLLFLLHEVVAPLPGGTNHPHHDHGHGHGHHHHHHHGQTYAAATNPTFERTVVIAHAANSSSGGDGDVAPLSSAVATATVVAAAAAAAAAASTAVAPGSHRVYGSLEDAGHNALEDEPLLGGHDHSTAKGAKANRHVSPPLADGACEVDLLLVLAEPKANVLGLICFMLALGLHSVLEGLALGTNEDEAKSLFITIILHKGFAAFSFGVVLKHVHARLAAKLVAAGVITLATPLGIVAGILWAPNPEGVASGVLIAMTAGTFLYIALEEVLQHTRAQLTTKLRRLLGLLALCLGYALMSILAIWV